MVQSKREFQAFSACFGVKIKSIRADNGAYASKMFKASCETDQQDLSFCAVGGALAKWISRAIDRNLNTNSKNSSAACHGQLARHYYRRILAICHSAFSIFLYIP